jgi:hypothetical protein
MSLPEVIFSAGSGSDRYYPGYLYFNWADLEGATTPLFVGASCATGDFAASENPAIGIPLSEKLLASDIWGPIAWVGPTAGTWQDGNEEVAQRVASELFTSTSRPMAESWLEAIRAVISENLGGALDRIAQTARSYVFLGDPLSRLKHSAATPTDVVDDSDRIASLRLVQNSPNPFNPMTRITFGTTRHGRVSLRVYDVRGQLVRTLVDRDLPPGLHEAEWRGEDACGKPVVSGVYLYRLVAEGSSVTRKLTLVK